MKQTSKKIVLLLVEGDSEEILLFNRLQELFQQNHIRFRVEHGDMLYNINSQQKSSKSIVGDRVKDYLRTYKLKESDILCVLHIVDIDGIFLSHDRIVIDTEISQLTFYEPEYILVKNEKQKERIQIRNEKRSLRIKEMCSTHTILPAKVPYQMYYFSGNLEHVLFNELNAQQDEKIAAIEEFMERLENVIEQYLQLFIGIPELEGKGYSELYQMTWQNIINNESKIDRLTNVPLLFNFIESKLNE